MTPRPPWDYASAAAFVNDTYGQVDSDNHGELLAEMTPFLSKLFVILGGGTKPVPVPIKFPGDPEPPPWELVRLALNIRAFATNLADADLKGRLDSASQGLIARANDQL
jgi:hypothetical protein